jgi:hypothetical protein
MAFSSCHDRFFTLPAIYSILEEERNFEENHKFFAKKKCAPLRRRFRRRGGGKCRGKAALSRNDARCKRCFLALCGASD